MGDEWLGQVIEGAYDAAVEGGWYDWLNGLRRSLGGSGAVLALLTKGSEAYRALPIACGDPSLSTGRLQHYLSLRHSDPWYQQARRQRNQVVILDEALRRCRADTELSTLFGDIDCHYSVGSILSTDHGHHLLGLYRGAEQSDFCPGQLKAIELVSRHLRQAMALTPFLHERIASRLADSRLSHPECPQAVVRANGTLAFANAAMEHYLCDRHTQLKFRRGRLGARQPLLQRLLDRAQTQACQTELTHCQQGRLPLGSDTVTITPVPQSVLPGAALWQIQPPAG
ncbi:hypothetical protein [Ferrimonas balearica]|uniref:hypothetical protein n=1 Tax=Ferrimonas balearica TaxID=44012 RepID=UPI001C995CA3|nr:hypothetical protein [Ferrimonas balearica]MBY5990863.1 hypothetical protein [Ferrimonas balearica]